MSAYRCPVCEYVYDEATGAPREGFPAGTPWSEVPDEWPCPDCGVREKVDFESAESLAQRARFPGASSPEARSRARKKDGA